MLNCGSLFSGAGLCDLGFAWAGFNHRWFCEVDGHCRAVLNRHWPGVPVFGDVSTLDGGAVPPVDVLCGGFPCQDVSLGGKREGIKEGTRSGLWRHFARIIGETGPRYVVIENVRGLLSSGMDIVLQDLDAIGYDAEWEVLPAAALGAAHHRERVFVIAYPHGHRVGGEARLFAPLQRIVGEYQQVNGLSHWLGIQFNRASKPSARHVYGGRVLHRVDDGTTAGLDGNAGTPADLPPHIGRITREARKAWMPRLKALGNGIMPQQAWAVAACILIAEGLPVPALPMRG